MITQKEIKDCVIYDEYTGLFTNKEYKLIANKTDKYGYNPIYINGKKYQSHRIAWQYVYGDIPVMIDHINTVKNDNRIDNLRLAPDSQNKQNRKTHMATNKHKLLGVVYEKGRNKFRASITVYGKNIFLGRHETPEMAHKVYLKAKRELHEACMI